MVTQLLVCDVGKEKSDDIFYVQGEKGRELIFDVINSFLDSSPSLSGYTATIHILKSDGNFTIANMTIDVNNKLHYTLTENDCAVSGNGIYDISLTKNNELIYSSHGYYIGDSRAVSDDVVNSVSVAYGVPFPEGFQEKLTAGDNITIDENNVISASGEQSFNYNDASNKPSINGVTLQGNKSTSDLQIPTYTAGDNVTIENNVISARDTTYTAGENVSIVNGVISAQDTIYTAGENITIENDVISASGGGGDIDVINIGTGTGTTSRTFTLPKTPKMVTLFWDEGGQYNSWSTMYNIIWGFRRAYGIGGNTDSAVTNQTSKVAKITFNGTSFTISAGDAGSACNTTGANDSGKMIIMY